MSLKVYSLDAGPEGGSVTTVNSGANLVSLNGGTAQYRAAAALSGPFGVTLNFAASSGGCLMRFLAAGASSQISATFMFTVPTPTVGTNMIMASLRQNLVTGVALTLRIYSTGTLMLFDTNSAFVANIATGLSAGTKYRVGLVVSVATGTYAINVYLDTSATLVGTVSGSGADFRSANPVDIISVGFHSPIPQDMSMDVDYVVLNDGGTTEIGPPSSIAAPTTNAGDDQAVEPLSDVTLTATATNSPTSYQWTQVGGSVVALVGSEDTRTFTAPADANGDTLTFSVTATNANGTGPADTTIVTVFPQTEWFLTGGDYAPVNTTYI